FPLVIYFIMDVKQIYTAHDRNNGDWQVRAYNADIYRNLRKYIPSNMKIVGNCKQYEDINVMFYNRGITAYHYNFSEKELAIIDSKKIPIAVFKTHVGYPVPYHIESYPRTYIIDKELK